MKLYILTPVLLLAAVAANSPISAEEAPKPLPISELKDDTPIDTIYRSYVQLRSDDNASDESKASQAIRLLVIAQNYLKKHTRPEGEVQWNVQPPDGSIPGVAPERVRDPKQRAQYVKMIEDNNARAEGQRTYDSFQTLRDDIIRSSIVYRKAKPDKAHVISEAIAIHAKNTELATELKKLIADKAIEQDKQLPAQPK